MFLYLIKNRTKPKLFTHAWGKAWAKRLFHIRGLARILLKNAQLIRKGVKIGTLSVIGEADLQGRLTNLTVGNECFIGRNVHLALHDKIIVGNNVIINDGCKLLTASHDINCQDWSQISAPIVIEDYAWIATACIILPGVTIGKGAVIGAGSVVTKNVPPFQVAAGNPARIIKERTLKELSHVTVHWLAPFEAWTGIPKRKTNEKIK
ncbi:MAG: acyltransferase [Methylococcaceae bacterium]|jgi:maltose O-acetyltransferase